MVRDDVLLYDPKHKECCENCSKFYRLQHWDYKDNGAGGVDHIQLDGFVCTACGYEGVLIWMTGIDSSSDRCEEFSRRNV